jgi:molybdopterin-guanine dinucleotide biosynthesis protein A
MNFKKPAVPPYASSHRISLGVWGVGCRALRAYVQEAAKALPSGVSMAFLDAAHDEVRSEANCKIEYYHNSDFIEIYGAGADKDNYEWQKHELLLINAHHHAAEVNCLILDGKKPFRSVKELESQTHYIWIREGFEDLHAQLSQEHAFHESLLCFYESRGQSLNDVIKHFASVRQAPLHALILAGGKSTRMGHDKSDIDYHGMRQRDFLASLMEELNIPYRISCNHLQYEEWGRAPHLLPDRFLDLGPMSGMLTAYCEYPGSALLVLACDLPGMDKAAVQHLVSSRSLFHKVTAYRDLNKPYADPLAAIWEPGCYPALLHSLASGKTCPRRMLDALSLLEITVPHSGVLANANTPEELRQFQLTLQHEYQG